MKPEKAIPQALLETGRQVGQKAPLFYAGRRALHGAGEPYPSAHETVLRARSEAGITVEPEMPDMGPVITDPYEG
ncbi:MAG TPA: hypothetical protein VF401_02035 [Candidatus Saccharimonadales bacterium]